MAEGNLFFIQSRLSGMVLDVSGGNKSPGSQVIMWHRKDSGFDNQLWYEEPITGTIRSKDTDLCLEIGDGNTLIINYFNGGDDQLWKAIEDRVRNRNNEDRVLDIAGASCDGGARVCAWNDHGNDNQLWDFHYMPPRYFFIRSRMNGKVLDIKGNDADPGAKVITWDQNDDLSDNQLWYQDRRGFIRSKLNNLVMDSSDGKIEMQEYDEGKSDQMWTPVFHEGKIVNASSPGQAIDIKKQKDKNGAKIIGYEFHGGDNQLWDFEIQHELDFAF